jgi:shikimate dehydrogenase
VLALLVHPLGGNPMQYMMEKALAHHDVEWRYLGLEVEPEHLGDAVRGIRAMGFRGGSVAHPHQQAIVPLLDRLSEKAALIGAVNLLSREDDDLVGDNCDGKAVLGILRPLVDLAGKRALLLGAGSGARAVAIELTTAGLAELRMADRDAQRAGDLARLAADKFGLATAVLPAEVTLSVPEDIDVLLDTQPRAGYEDTPRIVITPESLRPELVVIDATAEPQPGRLLRSAVPRGCKTADGLSVLIEQMAQAFLYWTDVDPDRNILRDAAEEFLEL